MSNDDPMHFVGESLIEDCSGAARGLCDDRRGTVAVIFAFAAVPMTLLAGGAVDYSLAVNSKSHLQQSLDKGIMAAAVNANADVGFMKNYLTANMLGSSVTLSNVTLARNTQANGSVVYVGDGDFTVNTTFLKMVGINSINVHAHSEATLPSQIVTATFSPLSAQGAFAKDIFIWTKDASGALTSKQTVLTYRYGVSGSGTTPAIGSWTVSFTVPKYSTFGVGMLVYQDLSNTGELINPVEMYSDVHPETFVHQTGKCSDAAGEVYNMEDGGDANFLDFVYNMKCTMGVAANTVARLSK